MIQFYKPVNTNVLFTLFDKEHLVLVVVVVVILFVDVVVVVEEEVVVLVGIFPDVVANIV